MKHDLPDNYKALHFNIQKKNIVAELDLSQNIPVLFWLVLIF